jgi:tetratricopeptide (TPR) repeat protein
MRYSIRYFSIRFLAPAIASMALIAPPILSMAYAAGADNPSSAAAIKEGATIPNSEAGYRAAYARLGVPLLATIYDRHDYVAAIDQLKALGRDDDAAVANLLGYSYRKLGDYRTAQVWYERALRADPNHVRTWQYYGMWQIEQGNREAAQYHLSKIAQLVGTNSDEYRSLAAALEQPPGTSLVY